MANYLDARKVGVAADMVRVGLGIDQVLDPPVLAQTLPPLNRVDRLLRRVDHEHAIRSGEDAWIAAPEVDLGEDVLSDAAHQNIDMGGRPVRARL